MSLRRSAYGLTVLFLLVSCGGGNDPVPTPVDSRHLSFAQAEIGIGYDRTAFSVSVDANFDYRVDIQADWVKADPDRTSTPSTQYFLAERNPVGTARTATLRFIDRSDRYYAKDVTVTQAANPLRDEELSIVDKNATPETKALLANLWAIADKGWMFGHHDDLWYGRYWYNQAGKSDTKDVCGDYPAVFSVDFAEIMDDRHGNESNAIRRRVILEARERGEVILACMHLNNPKTGGDSWDNSSKLVVAEIMDNRFADEANAIRRRVILEARERGEVILACMHLNNPLTGGDSWDNSSNKVVSEILTNGTATRTKYLEWLDRCADFALNLKDSRGNLVPVIFRMYHEHTQNWSWWGSSCTTASEFVALWQFTVRYLRDTKGVHNFLYAISPQMDEVYPNAQERILSRWPGDDWVDFIGIDSYHGTWDDAFKTNLDALESVSLEKRKPCGVTETGKESFTEVDFWTRHVLEPVGGHRVSMVTMWRNKYVGNNESDKHYFSIYPGHPSEDDFRTMYNAARSLFSRDLPDMYTLPQGYDIK